MMTIETALNNLKKLHDNIKEHPYWISFNHDMFKQDVIPMYIEVMKLYSYLRFNKEYKDSDSPWFAMMSTIYHDFSSMLGRLRYNETHESDNFKQYYLPALQNFLQILHFFIEGMNTEEHIIMYMPENIYHPKFFTKYTCVYHDNWKDSNGYKFWCGDYKWRAIVTIKETAVSMYTSSYEKKLEETNSPYMREFYEHRLMDIKNRTSLSIKIEK